MQLKRLIRKIKSKKAKVGIVGMGYVGLPLALAFLKKGFSVTGIDIDATRVAELEKGISPVLDVSSIEMKKFLKNGCFVVTTDYAVTAGLDAILICVPTPLNKTKEPDISHVVDTTTKIAGRLHKGQLIVLESTTYPGTTEEIMLPLLAKSGLVCESDFFLSFSPERVDPGNKQFDVVSIPKVVGGVGKRSLLAACALYGSTMKNVVPVSSAKTAEMVKLLENTFRSVNIGLINEIAVLSNRIGVDIWEVVQAAKTKPFGFMPFYPGPGIGGHCLPIDPLYLSWKSRLHGYEAKMIELASAINESMPSYVIERLAHILNAKKIPLKGASILILGVSYKPNTSDLRESPALDVMDRLLNEGSVLSYADPYVKSFKIKNYAFSSKKLTPGLVRAHDCVVVLTGHTSFDVKMVAKHAPLILDTRNILRKMAPKPNLFFL